MTRTSPLKTPLIVLVSVAAGALIATLALRGRPPAGPPDTAAAPAHATAAKSVRYHCPMHPAMISDHPGNCPICQMQMVPIEEAGAHPEPGAAAPPAVEGRARVSLPPDRLQRIGVRTAAVERRELQRTIRAVGRVTTDETRLHHVHTKVGGWIERVHASATGEQVKQGQPLLTIYSPELLASQEEFLLALKARERLAGASLPGVADSGDDLVASARRRLRLLDMSDAQIDQLERSGVASRTTTLAAPMSGHIMVRNVQHGEMIEPGTTVLDIADLSRVWVVADVYEYELPFVRQGQAAVMTLPYLPGRQFRGTVGIVYPFLSEATRTVKVRLEFSNADLALKPDMYAEVQIQSDLGQAIVVPDSAIVSTGRRDLVFVEAGEGLFDPREVTVGTRLPDGAEILDGLEAGERVVVSGNFMIDSEAKLRAARNPAPADHRH